MKKMISSALVLLSLTTFSACSSLEEPDVVKETQQDISDVETTVATIVHSTEEVPNFHTAVPSVKRTSAGYDTPMDFDHMYEEVSWGVEEDKDEDIEYQFPPIQTGIVNLRDRITVDWRAMDPQPTEISLIELDTSDYPSKINEKNIVESDTITIEIDEEELGKRYAVQYLWKDGEVVTGETMLNFGFE